jgi:CheY-like chemotaxis protein
MLERRRYMEQSQPTIIVLDDDEDTAAFLCDFFGMLGLAALSCPVGPEASICIARHHPDLVILDVQLGGMTGIDVFHQLRDDSSMRSVPVIFFTGSEDKLRNGLPEYRSLGATMVVKPNFEQLGTLAQEMLHRHA